MAGALPTPPIGTLSSSFPIGPVRPETSDLTGLVIRAIGALIGQEIKAENGRMSGVKSMSGVRSTYALLTKHITDTAKKIVEDEEMDLDPDYVTSRRIGRTLGKMRITKADQSGGKQRAWAISLGELERWCIRYAYDLSQVVGFDVVETNTTHSANATDADSATNAAEEGPLALCNIGTAFEPTLLNIWEGEL